MMKDKNLINGNTVKIRKYNKLEEVNECGALYRIKCCQTFKRKN